MSRLPVRDQAVVALCVAAVLLLLGFAGPASAGNSLAVLPRISACTTRFAAVAMGASTFFQTCLTDGLALGYDTASVQVTCSDCTALTDVVVGLWPYLNVSDGIHGVSVPPARSVSQLIAGVVRYSQQYELDGISQFEVVLNNVAATSRTATVWIELGCLSSPCPAAAITPVHDASPSSLAVTGTVGVNNFPATQPVSGTVTADAGSGTLAVHDSSPSTQAVTGSFWQATQPVSGSFWQVTQPVSVAGTVATTGGGGGAGLTVDDSHRLDLMWWGVWGVVGLLLVLVLAPFWRSAWGLEGKLGRG
ncbi:MAG TPA: hypothetical protein VIL92_06535 [Gaiellaceae bacterium]